jgi:TonB-linked SusC/RagA family outer membrane protein
MYRKQCRTSLLAAGMAVVMLLAGAVPLWAQTTGSVRGTVTVQLTDRPLSGARIQLLGTQLSGTADQSGNFEIRNVPMGTYTIRTTIIGYASMETAVNVTPGQPAVVNFSLNPAAISLDEIVVTGTAGAQEKKTIGNSVGTIQVGAQLETAPITNATELLTARTPGLTLMANSGQTGSSSNIRIRGAGSLSGGYAPVFYVDGIRIESGTIEAASTYQGGNALDFLNPQDIESIEVIKGPAAATLYGADAANGVIQIITKKGQRGSNQIQWTASMEFGQNEWTESIGANTTYWHCTASRQASSTYPGCQDPTQVKWWGVDHAQCVTAREGVDQEPGWCKANGDPFEFTGIPAEDIIDVGDGTFVLKDDPLFRHPAALREGNTSDFNISARGGTGSVGYFLSFNRNAENGVFFNNFSRRTGGRANFDVNVSETVDLAVQFGYARTELQQPINNNASNSINRNAMRGRARGQSRTWEPGFRGFNPWLSNEFDRTNNLERMTIGVTGTWSPFDWFRNKLTLGLDKQNYRETEFYRIDTTGLSPWGTTNATGTIDHEIPNIHRWTVDYSGSLDFDLNENFNSQFSAGMQLNSRTYRGFFTNGEGLVANNLNLISSAAVTTSDEQRSEQTSLGFYLQEQVGWRDRLFVTGALRIDDNSAFGSDFSLVVYPKASVAWVISDEDFYNVGFTDQLKLRFAWGQAGNAPAPFTADRTYGVGQGVSNDNIVNTVTVDDFGNPDLKAETGSEWEVGFDASLFDGRAGLEFTYYNQHTKDALIRVPDAGSTGFTGSHLTNIGEIANSGIEILLTGSPIFARSFQWDFSLAFATNNNELVSFGVDDAGNPIREEQVFGSFADVQRHREGFPMGAFWAVDVERDASGEPVLDGSGNVNLLSSCRWAPSDPTWDQATECDDIYMGPSRPTREAALTNTFTVLGNLRIFSQFDYRGGHYQWCAICSINSRIDLNTWDVNTGGTALNPDVSDADVLALRSRQTLSHITQADYIKFRELSLTYTLPSSWGRFFQGSRWSFTVSGRNLFVWTKYEGRGDPEVQFSPNSSFNMLDYASTPQTRRLSASMRVTF